MRTKVQRLMEEIEDLAKTIKTDFDPEQVHFTMQGVSTIQSKLETVTNYCSTLQDMAIEKSLS